MTIPARVKSLLEENQIAYAVRSHTPTFTAQEEAAALHVPGKEVAKTVVLRAGNELVLGVLRAPDQVNLKKLEQILGEPVRLASEQEFVGLFPDCEPGATPPFGLLYSLRVLVDDSLADNPEIILSAGTHRESLRMRYSDFSRLARPQVCSFTERNLGASKAEISLIDVDSLRKRASGTPLYELNVVELAERCLDGGGLNEVNRLLELGWRLLHIYNLPCREVGGLWERPIAILGRSGFQEEGKQ